MRIRKRRVECRSSAHRLLSVGRACRSVSEISVGRPFTRLDQRRDSSIEHLRRAQPRHESERFIDDLEQALLLKSLKGILCFTLGTAKSLLQRVDTHTIPEREPSLS